MLIINIINDIVNDSEKKYLSERYLRNIKINIDEDKVMRLEIKS